MKATFDNQERDFDIAREHVPYLEHSPGRGLYAVLRDFTEGQWTFSDIATVISFAMYGPSRNDKQAIGMVRQSARYGVPTHFAFQYKPHPDVVSVMERDGHGNFAPLAADVLTYTIFGKVADDATA